MGCRPVGQFAIASAFLLGAGRVFAVDTEPLRLAMAAKQGAEPINFNQEDPAETLMSKLVDLVQNGTLNPTMILTEREPMTDALSTYKLFNERRPGWIKVELTPSATATA